jgi:hypothetical protein
MNITVHKTGADGMIKMADKILANYELANSLGCVPLNIKGQATISVLSSLKHKKHFSVCDVDNLAELHDIVIPREIQKFFDSMHCVDWNEMTQETRDYLMAMLVKIFEQPITQSQI